MIGIANGSDQEITTVIDPAIYTRMSNLAAGFLRREGRDLGWEAADLVHEAFLRLACSRSPLHFHCTAHLVALSAVVMRHILTDRTRATGIFNRSQRVVLDPDLPATCTSRVEIMTARNALERLRGVHGRAYQVVKLHAIYGMGLEEVASKLSVCTRTVKRDWSAARKWLGREVGGHSRQERQKTEARS